MEIMLSPALKEDMGVEDVADAYRHTLRAKGLNCSCRLYGNEGLGNYVLVINA